MKYASLLSYNNLSQKRNTNLSNNSGTTLDSYSLPVILYSTIIVIFAILKWIIILLKMIVGMVTLILSRFRLKSRERFMSFSNNIQIILRIDRKYEKIVERRMQHLLKLRRENQELKAFRLRFIEQCEALTKSTRAFRIAAERRQMMTILSIVAMIYGGSLSSNSLL
uniref:Uncharacterized protein n=1 Tax=Heterorhabditis bacteriophora TaxID=37862 RepID=A0A1I7WY55_HETBA